MLIRVWPLQLHTWDKGKAEDEAEDKVEDEVVDVDATTIIYLMISIGTLINLPMINWSMIISLVVNYNLTMWIAKPCPLTENAQRHFQGLLVWLL